MKLNKIKMRTVYTMKNIIVLSLIAAGSLIAISCLFAGPKTPTANEYIKMKKKVLRLERQIGIMQSGWQQCLEDYENLMLSCKESCNGTI